MGKYRKHLAKKLRRKGTTEFLDSKVDKRATHTRIVVAKEGRDRLRSALGIKTSFVDGTSMASMNSKKTKEEEEDSKGMPGPV